MKGEPQDRLRTLFDAACRLTEQKRQQYLDCECGDDVELRRRLESLLDSDQREGGVLDRPLLTSGQWNTLINDVMSKWQANVPEQLGRYRVVREIGSGSMGTVFEAELENPPRSVAIKVLRPGVSTTGMLQRFQFEASVLRSLDHPCVARFYEAGTTDTGHGPQPFFAMEMVEGRPLTDFAREQGLSIRERVELMAQVCDAVHHAHTKGVIHRDLKPGNILVDRAGRPRVLDFGVARAVDTGSSAWKDNTVTGQLIGTLRYMSPEQAAGASGEIDTRCDIYALGVIGFELLGEHPPYETANVPLPEAVRTIREIPPARLGTYSPACRGDVETIIGKALEKDKDQRYQAASDLAADLRRFLRHEPIVARPPSVLYQLGKYARRNKAWFTGVVAVLACIALGVAGTAYGLVKAVGQRRVAETRRVDAELARGEAERQRLIAEQRLGDAEQARAESEAVTTLMESLLRSVDPDELGREVLVLDVLNQASATIGEELTDRPLVEARLRENLGSAYQTIGEHTLAFAESTRAVKLRTEELGDSHPQTLSAMRNAATAYGMSGHYAAAAKQLEEVLEAQKKIIGEEHVETLSTMNNLGTVNLELGRYDEAERLYESVLAGRRRVLGDEHPNTLSSMANVGYVYSSLGQYERAESAFLRALEISRRVRGEQHPQTLEILQGLALTYQTEGRYEDAERIYLDLLDGRRRAFGERDRVVANLLNDLAEIYRATGRFDKAEAHYTEAIRIENELFGPENFLTLMTVYNQALMYQEQGRIAEAKNAYVSLLPVLRRVRGEEHRTTQKCVNNLAAILMEEGAYAEAEPLFRSSIDFLTRSQKPTHSTVLAARSNLGDLCRKMGRLDEARQILNEVVDAARRTLPARHWFIGVFLVKYGRCLVDLGEFEEAEDVLVEGRDVLLEAFGPDHQRTVDAELALRDLALARTGSEPP